MSLEADLRAIRITAAILALLVIVVAALFTIQNLSRTSDLSLSLGFYGVHLQDPLPVPYLVWGALGIGLLIGGGWGIQQRIASGKKVRELQRKLARASLSEGGDPWKP